MAAHGAVLRVLDGGGAQQSPPLRGWEVIDAVVAVLDEMLPRVRVDDPSGPALRELHLVLGASALAPRRAGS
jgi:hypothetical protein